MKTRIYVPSIVLIDERILIRIVSVFLLFFIGAATSSNAQDQDVVALLAALAESYEDHVSSIAFKSTHVQEIVSEDPSRPRVVAPVTTNQVDLKIKDGKAIVSHQAFIGPDINGDLVDSAIHAIDEKVHRSFYPRDNQGNISEIDVQTESEVFMQDRVLAYMFLPPPGFNKQGLSTILRQEDGLVVMHQGETTLYGDDVLVCSVGEVKLWIDAENGGILRRLEERRSGRLRKIIEVPSLMKLGDISFPTEIRYTSFNRTHDDANGEALPYLVNTISVAPDSVRINDLEDDELLFDFPDGTAVRDNRTGVSYYAGGQTPPRLIIDDMLIDIAEAEKESGHDSEIPPSEPIDDTDNGRSAPRSTLTDYSILEISILGFVACLGLLACIYVYRKKISKEN